MTVLAKKEQKRMVKGLSRLINRKPSVFNDVCGIDMKKISPSNRLREIRKCFKSGPIGRRKIAKIIAIESNLIPFDVKEVKDLNELHNRSVLDHVKRKEKNLSHLKSTGVNNLDPLFYSEVTSGNTSSSEIESLPGGEDSSEETQSNNSGALLQGISSVIDSTTGALSLFFGQPESQQQQEVVVVPGEERKSRDNTISIVIGIVVVGLVIGGIVYYTRNKK